MITHLVVAKHTPLDDTEATKFDDSTAVEEYQRGLGSGRDEGGGETGEEEGRESGRDGGGGGMGEGEGRGRGSGRDGGVGGMGGRGMGEGKGWGRGKDGGGERRESCQHISRVGTYRAAERILEAQGKTK